MLDPVQPMARGDRVPDGNSESSKGKQRFIIEMIKPSHYDDDGYVIQWWKAWVPARC